MNQNEGNYQFYYPDPISENGPMVGDGVGGIEARDAKLTARYRCVNIVPNPLFPGNRTRCGWIGLTTKSGICPKCRTSGHMSLVQTE